MNFASLRRMLRSLSWRPPPRSPHLRLGRQGEREAARFLRRRSLRIVERNYRCPVGEIDLIAVDGDTLVFVEVKTRRSDRWQDPVDTVTAVKWSKVERAARYYLAGRRESDRPYRFDMVTVVWPSRGRPIIEHLEDAFVPRSG